MNLLLFIVMILISFTAIRIGAIAFELTGLEWSLAKFQALSCFTGTGFTTKEAELITSNPQRRKIASFLMVLGNAGLVTLIATFANSLRPAMDMPGMIIPFLGVTLSPHSVAWINLAVIVVFLYVIYRIFMYTKITRKLTDIIRSRIIKKDIVRRVTFEELLVATGGYGVSQIDICENSPILNKTILESELKKEDIIILAIERNGETMPNPPAETKIFFGDKIICFGKLGSMRRKICVT
ncbi:MAG: hypothetical protein KKH08_05830 [Candidatus Omnitrophica bacterium]|nr:hypothetical protein [Candidatus Omnitrophota bacterium]